MRLPQLLDLVSTGSRSGRQELSGIVSKFNSAFMVIASVAVRGEVVGTGHSKSSGNKGC